MSGPVKKGKSDEKQARVEPQRLYPGRGGHARHACPGRIPRPDTGARQAAVPQGGAGSAGYIRPDSITPVVAKLAGEPFASPILFEKGRPGKAETLRAQRSAAGRRPFPRRA